MKVAATSHVSTDYLLFDTDQPGRIPLEALCHQRTNPTHRESANSDWLSDSSLFTSERCFILLNAIPNTWYFHVPLFHYDGNNAHYDGNNAALTPVCHSRSGNQIIPAMTSLREGVQTFTVTDDTFYILLCRGSSGRLSDKAIWRKQLFFCFQCDDYLTCLIPYQLS